MREAYAVPVDLTSEAMPCVGPIPGELVQEMTSAAERLGLSVPETVRLALQLLQTEGTVRSGPIAQVAPWQPGELSGDYASETDDGYPLTEWIAVQRWGA